MPLSSSNRRVICLILISLVTYCATNQTAFAQANRPTAFYGVVKVGTNDASIGKAVFPSRGAVADRIFARCRMGDLCEVQGNLTKGVLTKVAAVNKAPTFSEPAQVLRYVYNFMAGDHDAFWLEDDDLESLYTPRMSDLLRRSRHASDILQEESAGAAPWIDGQESDIRNVKIVADDEGGGRAMGIATFRNFARENPPLTTYTFDLVRTSTGWRIDDRQFPISDGRSTRYGKTQRLSVLLKGEIEAGEREEHARAEKAKQALATASRAAALARPGRLCGPDEGSIINCKLKGRVLSICTSGPIGKPHDWIEYRAGVRDKLELSHRSSSRNGIEDFYGAYELFAHGSVSYIRFKRGDFEYVAYEDEASRPYASGLMVRKNGKRLADLRCEDGTGGEAMPVEPKKMPSNLIEEERYDPDKLR